MGICTDKSVNYLKTLGLNTILHPREDVAPLMLIGEYGGARGIIGTLDQLLDAPAAPLPAITAGVASNINGQRTSKLPVNIGLDVLGNVIGALGGSLGFQAAYDSARTVEFTFQEVTRHRANTIAIGDFLETSDVRWNHLILEKYLFGKGNLYAITEVVRSKKLGVTSYAKSGGELKLDVPAIRELIGGTIAVGASSDHSSAVTYEGDRELTFGFLAIELSAGENKKNGELALAFRPLKPGAVTLGLGGGSLQNFEAEGPLAELAHIDPARLGE